MKINLQIYKAVILSLCIGIVNNIFGIPNVKAIVGGTLVNTNGEAPIEKSIIIIKDNKIDKIGSLDIESIPKDAEIINAHGKWIIPGLVNSHIHFFQSGSLYTRPDIVDLRKIRPYQEEVQWIKDNLQDTFSRLLRCGITSVVDTGGPFWNFEVRNAANKSNKAPRIAVAGPLISTFQPIELTTEDSPILKVSTPEQARLLVQKEVAYNPDLIKIWFIVRPGETPEDHLDIVKAAIDESHKHNIRVAIHATELETARVAVKAGADILVHSVEDKEVDQSFVELLKQKKVIYITALTYVEGYRETLSQQLRISLVEHKLANPYLLSTLFDIPSFPDKDIPSKIIERTNRRRPPIAHPAAIKNLKLLQEAGVRIAAGTDAGNIGTFHGVSIYREFELMSEAGLSPMQILVNSTINGAYVMGREHELGTIEKGKLADMVILNSDPLMKISNTEDIYLVLKDGHVYNPTEIIKNTPEDTVQRMINALNDQHLNALLSTFGDNAKLYTHPNILLLSGTGEIKKYYSEKFGTSTHIHCTTTNRIKTGDYVINHERRKDQSKNDVINTIGIYEVHDNVIQNVWFINQKPH